jgi:hypothetical protein
MSTTSPPTSSVKDLISRVEQTVEFMARVLPNVELISGFVPGVGPELVAAEQAAVLLAPRVEDILKFLMAETGVSPLQAVKDFLDHITPGLATSPVLAATTDIPADKPGV